MTILKYIVLISFIFLLVVFEISWQVFPKGISCVFVLMMVLLLSAVEVEATGKFRLKYALSTAIFGGFILDLYSIFPPGLFFLSILSTFYICYRFIILKFALLNPAERGIHQEFNLLNFLGILIIGIISALVYQLLILFFSYLYYFVRLSDIKILLNELYFANLMRLIFLNGLLTAILFWVILKFKNLRHSR